MNKLKEEIKILMGNMENCLDDDFENFWFTDINNWISELKEHRNNFINRSGRAR